ncbi:MAG: serine--tRNA ligase [Candidatus Omnitrophota bacterium]|nr:MAG: serine--tRNA ligase [Candidatus Omnitrophota bacterium]
MLDPKFIRQNLERVRQTLEKRNYSFNLDGFLRLDKKRRTLLGKIEELYARQNQIDSEVKRLLKEKKDPHVKIKEGKSLKKEITDLEKDGDNLQKKFVGELDKIPNKLDDSVPIGDSSHNKIIREAGSIRKFDFKPLDHIFLAEHLDIIDFKRSAKLTGSNFFLFKGDGARLERALINFMLDLHTSEHGYKEVFPAVLVNSASMRATGQLPNLKEDMYYLQDDDLFLIPTAEVPVTNIHRDEILSEEELPIYYAAYTACFRREAGSYGKDTKGLIRVHQFDKVELVKFVKPDQSYEELEKLLQDACKVIELLNIPYRVNLLASGDTSFAAAKCYDIEIYAPGLDKWLEVSSCSNFEDFQARRGKIRYRERETRKVEYVHTLNGSGVALARLVIALLENYQQKDGSIIIPPVLRDYMGGLQRMGK